MPQAAVRESSSPHPPYRRHRPEQRLLYQIVKRFYRNSGMLWQLRASPYPRMYNRSSKSISNVGAWNMGSYACNAQVAIMSTWSPSVASGARRMAESAALLVDEMLPREPMRQWVLSFPFQLRFLFASRPELMGTVLGIVYRAIASHLIEKAGLTQKTAQTGAVTLIQRFGSTLNLNVHFHMLFLDGVFTDNRYGKIQFRRTIAPNQHELTVLLHLISHQKVLNHWRTKGALPPPLELLPATRASPQDDCFG